MSNLNIEKFFKSFPTIDHKRNRFPFEKEINFNMKMGEITPIALLRTVPGQTYNLDLSTVIKVAPLSVPPMDNAVLKLFAFSFQDRINWDNYKYWFGEKKKPENPEEEPTYLVPKVTLPKGGFAYNSFYDNIGCNPAVGNYKIDASIPRGDRRIYNKYFRNQALENPLEINNGDADDDPNQNMELRKICKPRDLFTQCLPNQSGTESVEIPLGSYAPIIGTAGVKGNGKTLGLWQGDTNTGLYSSSNQILQGGVGKYGTNVGTTGAPSSGINNKTVGITLNKDMSGMIVDMEENGIIADLSKSLGAPLEGLYQAIAYNTLQYITSRGGNRYFEHLSNIYGVANPDGVLQDPEFLGSLTQMIDFDTVTQTSSTSGEATPLANRAANGYAENYGSIINKSFGEFGWIIIYGVITYYPKYQQGVSKLMDTNDPLELFNPLFNLMGDEAIYMSDIYIQDNDVKNEEGISVNDTVWGYGKRNSRLLYPVNEVHGEQRSSYPQSLDANHFAEYFTEAPKLNKNFDKINDNGFKRALTVTNETQFVCNSIITGTQDIEIPLNAIPSPIPAQLLNQK